MAATVAGREVIYLRDVLEDFKHGCTDPTPLMLDSKSAIDLAFDPVSFKKTKHVLRHAFWLRDVVARGLLQPTFVPGNRQLADVLTKALPPALHRVALRQLLSAPDERPAADCVEVSSALSPAVSVREGVLEDGRDAPSDGPAPMGVTPTPSSVG